MSGAVEVIIRTRPVEARIETGGVAAFIRSSVIQENIIGIPGPAGTPGKDGSDGAPGPKGEPGTGVPAGGADGQVLVRQGAADAGTAWAQGLRIDPATGIVSLPSFTIASLPAASTFTAGSMAYVDGVRRVAVCDGSAWTYLGAFTPASLFTSGEHGAFYEVRPGAVWADTTATTAAQVGGLVARLDDLSGNGEHMLQPTSSKQPVLRQDAAGKYYLEFDGVDDYMEVSTALPSGDMYIGTRHGYMVLDDNRGYGGTWRFPMNEVTRLVLHAPLPANDDALVRAWVDTHAKGRKWFIGVTSDTTIYHLLDSPDGPYEITFTGANGAEYKTTDNNTTTDVAAQGLTAPVAMVIPDKVRTDASMTKFNAGGNQLTGGIPSLPASMTHFYAYNNQLTGGIPSLPASMTHFYVYNNQLTGGIPSLPASIDQFNAGDNQLTGGIPSLPASMTKFYVYNNQLTGSIPSLPASMTHFRAYNNQLTDFSGTVGSALGYDHSAINNLTQTAVDNILAAFVAAGRTSDDGQCELYLYGGGNAAPSSSGENDRQTLIDRGWTVSTN